MQEKGMDQDIIAIKALASGDDSLTESEESEEL